jgi:hypothetical protein
MFFAKHIPRVVVSIRCPAIVGAQYFGYTPGAVADIFPLQAVEALFYDDPTQSVQPERVFFANNFR